MLLGLLENWKKALDSQIGDTECEIVKRLDQNKNAVSVRHDLKELIDFIAENDLPEGVVRALERCLNWNPHASERGD